VFLSLGARTNKGAVASPSPKVRPFEVDTRLVLSIAIPVTIAFITTPLLGIVDTGVVGQFGDPALIGGLAIGAILVDLLFTTFNFLRSGTTGLTAQALGAGNRVEINAILLRAGIMGAGFGVLVFLFSPALLWLGIYFIEPSPAVAEAVRAYFYWRAASAPFALLNYVVLGWLLGLGLARKALLIQLLLNGTNITLSLYLGLTLGWGIHGVAMATLIAEIAAVLAGILVCRPIFVAGGMPGMDRLKQPAAWKRLTNLNGDIMVRSFCLVFAFSYFAAQGQTFGDVTLAANAILMHFFMVSSYFLDGVATAVEQIVGRAIGANYRPSFNKGVRLTTLWGGVMAAVLAGLYLLVGDPVIGLLAKSEAVVAEAQTYLLWAALIPLVGVLAFIMDGVFIGATWSRDMSLMMVLSVILYLLAWQIMEVPMGNHGLWLALYVFLGARGFTLLARLPVRMHNAFDQGSGP